MEKIYYHFDEIAGKTLPLKGRRVKNLPGFELSSGKISFILLVSLLFPSEPSLPRQELSNESLGPLFITELSLLIELLKTVDAPSLVAFLALFMYFYTPFFNEPR